MSADRKLVFKFLKNSYFLKLVGPAHNYDVSTVSFVMSQLLTDLQISIKLIFLTEFFLLSLTRFFCGV